MVVVLKRHKAERLQHAVVHFPHGTQDFGHAVHGACLRLKSNFDKVAFAQRLGQTQEAAGYGNGLEFAFRAPAVFQPDRSQDRIS